MASLYIFLSVLQLDWNKMNNVHRSFIGDKQWLPGFDLS